MRYGGEQYLYPKFHLSVIQNLLVDQCLGNLIEMTDPCQGKRSWVKDEQF